MVELQCGEFVLVGTDVNTGHPRWRAQLTPHPIAPAWQNVLLAEADEARRRGVYLGEGGIELHSPTGGFIFHASEGTETAIAEAMREIVVQANARMAEHEARDAEYGRTRAATSGADSVVNMQRWVNHLSTMPPVVLYHYTTQRGLLGIAASKSLWATSLHRLADSSEFSGARDLGQAQLAQSLPSDAQLALHLKQALQSIARVNIYVGCFSEDGDRLSQWRAYCRDGGGVSLGFDPVELRALAAAQGFTLVKCIYDPTTAMAVIHELIQDAIVAHEAGVPLDKISETFIGWLYQIAPAIKHWSFSEEREWRLVSWPKRMDDPRVRYREGDTLITPSFDLSLVGADGRMRLVEAYTGPSRYAELAATTVSNFLHSQQIECRLVRPTITPFRL
jgi:DUF2971 family protein